MLDLVYLVLCFSVTLIVVLQLLLLSKIRETSYEQDDLEERLILSTSTIKTEIQRSWDSTDKRIQDLIDTLPKREERDCPKTFYYDHRTKQKLLFDPNNAFPGGVDSVELHPQCSPYRVMGVDFVPPLTYKVNIDVPMDELPKLREVMRKKEKRLRAELKKYLGETE